jgi:photosystem II stability/assembly factor-like uncharacterized protein
LHESEGGGKPILLEMKTIKILLMVAAIWTGEFTASAQTWAPTSAPTNGWFSVAMSADGSKLVSAMLLDMYREGFMGEIYTSTNYGVSWISNSVPLLEWDSVASSADGSTLVACSGPGLNGMIYTTTNSGAIWLQATNAPAKSWTSIACSADGTKLIAGTGYNGVYTSIDSGATWISNAVPYTNFYSPWVFVASSAGGTTLAVAVYSLGIYISTNAGTSWSQSMAPQEYWEGIASSADGTRLAAVARTLSGNAGPIYTSTDSGSTWVPNNVPNELWSSIASSADGTKLVAVSGGNGPGPIYVSTNSGASWALDPVANPWNEPWGAVASSADGNERIAVFGSGVSQSFGSVSGGEGPLYISQTLPSPSINISSTNGNLALSWLAPSTNFVLQQSLDLQGWSAVTNLPSLNLNDLNDEMSLPMTNGAGFYRLVTQ